MCLFVASDDSSGLSWQMEKREAEFEKKAFSALFGIERQQLTFH